MREMFKLVIFSFLVGCSGVGATAKQEPPWVGGWYAHYGVSGENELGYMGRDLRAFVDSPISESYLSSLDSKMAGYVGKGIILRFKYRDKDGPEPDAGQIVEHIRQLCPVIQKHQNKIAVWQAGFLGNYGEWWLTDLSIEEQRWVVDEIAECFPGVIALRTPMLRESVLGGAFWKSKLRDRLALHNDCFLSSRGNADTWARPRQAWEYAPSVFRGGETCTGPNEWNSCELAKREIVRQKFHYLNRTYHMGTLDNWKSEGCYDEITKYLQTGQM